MRERDLIRVRVEDAGGKGCHLTIARPVSFVASRRNPALLIFATRDPRRRVIDGSRDGAV
jgi:hypothetical protein